VLYLGSLIPRKGIYEALDAAVSLKDAPVEFKFVGAFESVDACVMQKNPRISIIGPVNRETVHHYYKHADVFILPTHSDGFGLTQLEAMSWKLPVISSKNCGSVVQHKSNGLILPSVASDTIVQAIEWCIHNAEQLEQMSHEAYRTSKKYQVDDMTENLIKCAQQYK
jgi:glycosyltransferase involved in cell wall biosynthesis